jgi:hypothetical protein
VESTVLEKWMCQSLERMQNSLTDEIFNELANKAGKCPQMKGKSFFIEM